MSVDTIDLGAVKRGQQDMWASGDYGAVAAMIQLVAERLVDSVDPAAGSSVLDVAGVDPVAAEELTVIPGAEEILALLELRLQALAGGWDVIVVDCAPTAETLRLLALPEALGWYMHRVFRSSGA